MRVLSFFLSQRRRRRRRLLVYMISWILYNGSWSYIFDISLFAKPEWSINARDEIYPLIRWKSSLRKFEEPMPSFQIFGKFKVFVVCTHTFSQLKSNAMIMTLDLHKLFQGAIIWIFDSYGPFWLYYIFCLYDSLKLHLLINMYLCYLFVID